MDPTPPPRFVHLSSEMSAERGVDAEALPIGDVTSLDRYGAVVLGSGIHMGRWLGEARRFAQVHGSALSMMPVWLFSSDPVGPPDHPTPPGTPAEVPVLLRLTRATAHPTFPGRLEMKRLRFAERAVARTIHAPDGDERDWHAIDRFAGDIAGELVGSHVGA
jgi:menaquinone-dependent protoporphyrinogen oxidase